MKALFVHYILHFLLEECENLSEVILKYTIIMSHSKS